ncbi:MAG TPA: hypothetical protein VM925_10260 [Labilithrix sp.]|nr:hypothetical protein [Labilithrix sp.]
MRSVLVVVVAILTLTGVVSAQASEPRTYQVIVAAPPGCGDVFFDEVRAQTSDVDLTTSNAASRLVVRVAKTSAGFHGELDLETAGAPAVRRSLEGRTCVEVVRGLALVAAVTIDPPRAASFPVVDAATGATENREAASTAPVIDASTSFAPTRSNLTAIVGGGAEVSSLASDGVIYLGGFGEVGWIGRGPRLRVRLGASLPTRVTSRSGAVMVSWLAGSVDICPIGITLSRDLALRPCVGTTLGSLHVRGHGRGLVSGDERDRLWAAGRLSAYLSWDLGPLTWGTVAGVHVPMTRETFVFQPSPGAAAGTEPVYQAPAIAAFGEIDLGVRFR